MTPNLVKSLINASEKAAQIARICRTNEKLLELLVQEKTGAEANIRFQHDFKTLADVLIQETIKHDIGRLFPDMHDAIKGEESPSFTNQAGVTIAIRVGETSEETASCLSAIIQGDKYEEALQALANEVHRNTTYNGNDLGHVPDLPTTMDYKNLGIWIDPIDATAEYISGNNKPTKLENISAAGLDCVTVLIGVYERDSGTPVIGVISQPFHLENNCYKSKIFWGVALTNLTAHNLDTNMCQEQKVAIFSSSEKPEILKIFKESNYEVIYSAGAGHKALKVITFDADVYLLSKGSTFKWDTCAPQAILRALNGNIFDFRKITKEKVFKPISYAENSVEDEEKCNSGGIVAVRDAKLLEEICSKLSDIFN